MPRMLLRRITALLSFVTVFHLAMAAPSRACSSHDGHTAATVPATETHDHAAANHEAQQSSTELPCEGASTTDCCPPNVNCASGILVTSAGLSGTPHVAKVVVASAVVNVVPTPAMGPEPPPPKSQVLHS